jgi:3-deoxy-7-phosphoheptulonate synthase
MTPPPAAAMSPETSDLRIRATKPLIAPAVLAEDLPLDDTLATVVLEGRHRIEGILAGEDPRLLAVVGPCSIHDPDAAVEYARLLADFAPRVADDLVLVMRVYFEKPRTILGWKGLINDPDLDGSYRINRGLRLAREVLLRILQLGVPTATEFLDTILGQYYADLVSWGAIGARTVESQVHRELASGLSMPVGFKNRTDGDVKVAVEAILSARHPHWFPSLTREGAPAVMGTAGNRFCHLVLRGGTSGPNYDADSIAAAVERLRGHDLPPRLMIDCSHANSGKDAMRQPVVAADLARQIAGGSNAIAAVMVESHLVAGAQPPERRPLAHGQSITDACLGWEDTRRLLEDLARAVARRRGR